MNLLIYYYTCSCLHWQNKCTLSRRTVRLFDVLWSKTLNCCEGDRSKSVTTQCPVLNSSNTFQRQTAYMVRSHNRGWYKLQAEKWETVAVSSSWLAYFNWLEYVSPFMTQAWFRYQFKLHVPGLFVSTLTVTQSKDQSDSLMKEEVANAQESVWILKGLKEDILRV